jgi:hypothetical protein
MGEVSGIFVSVIACKIYSSLFAVLERIVYGCISVPRYLQPCRGGGSFSRVSHIMVQQDEPTSSLRLHPHD